jgi:hypothetical protein
MNHPEESNLDGALETLRATPKRDPARVAAGRAAFRAQVEAAQRQQRALLFTQRLRRWRALFAFMGALLTGGAGAVYASQESLPDSPLYSVKLVSEDIRLAFTPGVDGQRALLQSFVERRRTEITTSGASEAAARARQRLSDHEAALQSIERAQTRFEPLSAALETPTATPPRLPATATAPSKAAVTSTPAPTETALPTQLPKPINPPSTVATAIADVIVTLVPTETPIPTPQPRRATATAIAATREAFATQLAQTREAVITRIAPTREAIATQLAPTREAVVTRIAPTREAIATQVAPTIEAAVTRIASTREAIATQVAPTREAIATQLAPTVEAIRATVESLPNLRETAAAAFPTPAPPAPPAIEPPPPAFPTPEPPRRRRP